MAGSKRQPSLFSNILRCLYADGINKSDTESNDIIEPSLITISITRSVPAKDWITVTNAKRERNNSLRELKVETMLNSIHSLVF